MTHSKAEFINDVRVARMDPVRRPTIVLIQVVRQYAPTVAACCSIWPAWCTEPLVVRRPLLQLPVKVIFVGRSEIKPYDHASLRCVSALLKDILARICCCR